MTKFLNLYVAKSLHHHINGHYSSRYNITYKGIVHKSLDRGMYVSLIPVLFQTEPRVVSSVLCLVLGYPFESAWVEKRSSHMYTNLITSFQPFLLYYLQSTLSHPLPHGFHYERMSHIESCK